MRTRVGLKATKSPYKNAATIEGGGKEKTSNTVEVFNELPGFEIKKEQRMLGQSYTTAKLDV